MIDDKIINRGVKIMEKSISKKTISKGMIIQGICFSLCFFAFQLTEFTINDRAESLMGAQSVNGVYSVGIACTALGFILFTILRRIFRNEKARKLLVSVIGMISAISSVILLFANVNSIFLASSFIALLSFGFVGANVYYGFSRQFFGNDYTGRVLGIGMGFAVILQFAVQNFVVTKYAFILSVVISISLVVFFEIGITDGEIQNTTIETKEKNNHLPLIIITTILLSLVLALMDGVVVAKHAEGSLSVSSYARLFYAISLIIAGVLADVKKRKYLALVTLCALFASTISMAFISNGSTFFLATVFMYIYSGFYVMYFTISFIDYAPIAKNGELIAGLGRIIRSIVASVTAIPVVYMFEGFGSVSLIVCSCIFSALVLLIQIKPISKAISTDNETKENDRLFTDSIYENEMIKTFSQQYKLTDREAEVFELLITTESGTQEIADSLYISRRVLQRYIAAIYEKTDTKTRVGLLRSYTEFATR